MNEEIFIKEVKKLGIEINETQKNQLQKYCKFLIETNKITNLTSINDSEGIYLKHFYDSLTLNKAIDFKKINTMLDIGTGAGFPGLVIKIIYPHIKLTLLDSNNKKISFLRDLIKILEIKEVELINDRAEDFIKDKREVYSLVTARAVSQLNILCELCMPFTEIGGYFIPLKGSNTEEIEDSSYAIDKLGGKIEDIITFNLPIEESKRNIIKIKKIKKTEIIYPRKYDKIKKNPLKKNNK